MKRILVLLLTVMLLCSTNSAAYAFSTNLEQDTINKTAVLALFREHGVNRPINDKERELFFQRIGQIDQLNAQIASKASAVQDEDVLRSSASFAGEEKRITEIERSLESMPIVKLEYADLEELFGKKMETNNAPSYYPNAAAAVTKPSVPHNINKVSFYGTLSRVYNPLNKKSYDVFEITATSRVAPKNYPEAWALCTRKVITLLQRGTYGSSALRKLMEVGSIINSTFNPSTGASLFVDAFVNMVTFAQAGASQHIYLDYIAGQTYIYTYVSDGIMPYSHVQTAEKVTLGTNYHADSMRNGVIDRKVATRNSVYQSLYYANRLRPVQRYVSYGLLECYQVNPIRYRFGGITKGSVDISYYPTLYSIPGA